jgi:acyl-CoA dehydrogenase
VLARLRSAVCNRQGSAAAAGRDARHHVGVDAEDFRQVRDAVRHLVREVVVPLEEQIEDEDRIPDELRQRAAEMGLFGYALPEEHGGLGVSMAEDVELAFEFGYTTPAFRSLFGTNNGIAGQVIAKFGSDEQQEAYLPRLASGELIGSFALTEAEAGSDPAGLRTTARRDGDGWVLNGTKRYITNAPIADLFVVFARSDPAEKGGRGISSFVVDAKAPGVTVGPRDKKMGQAGAWTAEVFLDDARVSADALIGEEGRGYAKALTVLSRGRLHIAALCVGMAQRVLDESVAYAATAKQGGAPVGRFQLVQAQLADTHAELLAGRAMVRDVAARYDTGEDTSIGPSSAKLFCTEMVEPGRRPRGAGARRPGLPADDTGRALLPRRPALPALRGHQRGAAGDHRWRAAAGRRHAAGLNEGPPAEPCEG